MVTSSPRDIPRPQGACDCLFFPLPPHHPIFSHICWFPNIREYEKEEAFQIEETEIKSTSYSQSIERTTYPTPTPPAQRKDIPSFMLHWPLDLPLHDYLTCWCTYWSTVPTAPTISNRPWQFWDIAPSGNSTGVSKSTMKAVDQINKIDKLLKTEYKLTSFICVWNPK